MYKELIINDDEDPHITNARERAYWIEKRASKIRRRSVPWFRRINRYKPSSISDTVRGRLRPVHVSEFIHYKWNVGIILCAYCNKVLTRSNLTRDHVTPIASGGTNHQDNLVPCCRECNNEKGDMSLLEFLYKRVNEPKPENRKRRKAKKRYIQKDPRQHSPNLTYQPFAEAMAGMV